MFQVVPTLQPSLPRAAALMLAMFALTARVPATTNESGWLTRQWLSDDGLPNNTVNGIVQSPDGFLWLATANVLCMTAGLERRYRIWVLLMGFCSVLVPFVLERVGVLPRSYLFGPGTITVLPVVRDLHQTPVRAGLLLSTLTAIIAPTEPRYQKAGLRAKKAIRSVTMPQAGRMRM